MTKQTKTVSIAGFVYYQKPDVWDKTDTDTDTGYSFSDWKLSADCLFGKVLVKTQTIAIEVPLQFDPRPQLIQNLEAEQRKAMADFAKLNTDILRKIGELQALEMTV